MDEAVRTLAEEYVARVKTGRGVAAVKFMLSHGSVTTDDLSAMGYEHPPRAIGDVRDNGIPVVTERSVAANGRRMALYRLGTSEQIRTGQTGRTNFSRKFRNALFEKYGNRDAITGAVHEARSLQIDHRVPYRVSGDAGLETNDVTAYMLLDAKSQRAKSWSCENCANFLTLNDEAICKTCFWAFPENYHHVAMEEVRRADIVWQGAEIGDYDALETAAESVGASVGDFLKMLGRRAIKPG